MAPLSIALFGPLRMTPDGEPLVSLYSDKVRALFAYLAVEHNRPHRRESLAGLFWPDYAERSARHSLSQALHSLRLALGQAEGASEEGLRLTTTAQTVSLGGTLGTVDSADFAALLESCQVHAHVSLVSCPICQERMQRAVALYTGDLLAGFSLPDSPAFEEWLLLQRESYHRLAVDALRTLASGEATSDDDARLKAGRRWVEIEPLDEEAHRRVMGLLAGSGHRSLAMAQYQACQRILRAELGVLPDEETQSLLEHIRAGDPALVHGPPALTTPAEPRAPPSLLSGPERYLAPLFVAREHELAQLRAHLEATCAGQPRVAFVTGEPGSGKTALLREFRQWALAVDSDLVTAVGHCNAHTGIGDPYLAFRELLAQLSGDVPERWTAGAISGGQARRLWGVAPETGQALVEVGPDLVGTLLPGGPLLERLRATTLDAGWMASLERLVSTRATHNRDSVQRAALFSQVTEVVQRLARRHPLLLILEDLHWADAGTVALLFHLGCHLDSDSILIVGAYRPTEVTAPAFSGAAVGNGDGRGDTRHPLVPVVHEFARRFGEIEVDLNRADGQGFVDALIDCEPNALGSEFRTTLLKQCDGNALFTVEILRELQERGYLVRDARGRWVEASEPDWASLPARVEGVLAERIGRLPPALQEALRVASVEGEIFTVEVLARVLGREPQGVVRWLSSDLDRTHRLVSPLEEPRAGSPTLGRYRFRHILVQSYLYSSLDPVERSYLHRGVAEALEAAHGEQVEPVALELARHYEQAGIADRAAGYLNRAGYRAAKLSAYQEAEELYTRALGLLEAVPESRPTRELELALRMNLSRVVVGTLGATDPRVGREYQRVRELSLELGQTPQLIEALMLLNGYYFYCGDYATAIAVAEEGAGIARGSGDPMLIALTRSILGWADYWSGDYVRALADLEPLISLVETQDRLADRDSTLAWWAGFAQVWKALTLARLGYPDQGRVLARAILDMARELGPAHELGNAIGGSGAGFDLLLRKGDTALEWANQVVGIADEWGYPHQRLYGRQLQGRALCALGRHHEAVAVLLETMHAAKEINYGAWLPVYLCRLGESYTATGQLLEAHDALERGMALAIEKGEKMTIPELHMARGALRLANNPPDIPGAEAELGAALNAARRQQARLFELRAAVALGRLWLSQGRSEEARALVQPVYDWFTEGFDTPDLVEARAFLVELAR